MEATAEVSTPVSTSDAVPAAPATSAPTSTESTSQRPTSMRDAFEQVAAATPDPSPAAAAAIVPPGTDPTATITPAPKAGKPGEPPQEKWPQILENARTKATQDAQAKFDQEYGWAKTIDRAALTQWTHTAQRMASDPIGFMSDFVRELEAHPTYGPQLRSHAGRMLASGRNGDPEPQPDVQIVDAAGHVTGMTYSAKALAERDAWRERKVLAQVDQRLQPIQADRERQQADAHAAELSRQAHAVADTVMGRVDAILDGDTAMYAHMDALMAAHPQMDAIDAALQVRKTHIVPTLEAKAQQKALDIQKQKAAGTTANGTGVAATPTRPRTRQELAAHLAALHGS